jgi:hypothetical protein
VDQQRNRPRWQRQPRCTEGRLVLGGKRHTWLGFGSAGASVPPAAGSQSTDDVESHLAPWRPSRRDARADPVPTGLRLVRTVTRNLMRGVAEVGGGAGVVVGLDLHDVIAARNATESLDAPVCLSFDIVPATTSPGDRASCSSVVVAAGRVHTTTSPRARRWARDRAGPRAGACSVGAPAILGSVLGRRCR